MSQPLRILLLFTVSVASAALRADAGAPRNPAPTVSIRLIPDSSVYDLERTLFGRTASPRFTAVIKNEGRDTITVAHPCRCWPRDVDTETRWTSERKRGKWEVLVKIVKPDATSLVLREGPSRGGFEGFGSGEPFLVIPPGESREFMVGWFFLNARGKYERDDKAAVAFSTQGTYRVKILYRNSFPKVRCFQELLDDVWTGVLESPTVTVRVR